MFKNDHATSVALKPVAAAASGAQGYFADAPPGSAVAPTVVTHVLLNTLIDEVLGVVTYAGLVPDKANDAQLLAAILSLVDAAGAGGAQAPIGMTLAMTPAFTTTRVTLASGLCRDSTNTARITFAAPISKRLDAAWAAGTTAGGRDTGALANGQTWHVFAIFNPTTLVSDGLFSQSPTAPTLPAGFTKFRWLGAVLLDVAATTIRPFVQDGGDFIYTLPAVDYTAQANGGGAPTLRTLSVPNGIKVNAHIHFQDNGTVDNNPYYSGLFDPDLGAPGAWGLPTQRAQVRRIASQTPSAVYYSYATVEFSVKTDTAQHVYSFSSDAADVIAIKTRGWSVDRSKFVP